MEKSVHANGQRRLEEIGKMFEGRNVWAEEGMKKKALVGEKLYETEEDGEGLDSLEVWRLKKLRREKRELEERKQREKEGMVNRGKELGRWREEVKALRSEFRDWKEEVDEIRYILGKSEEDARGYAVDLEVERWGKELRKMIGDVGRMVEDSREGKVEVRSEVVVLKVVNMVKKVEKKIAVERGRSYREVLEGVRGSMKVEVREMLEEKMEMEREVAKESLLDREDRANKTVEVVLESQGTEGEKSVGMGSWNSGKMEEELGLEKGEIVKVVGRKGKVVVELKESKGREVLEGLREEVWEKALRKKVEEVKVRDSWVGMVLPAMAVEKWKGRMGDLKEELEMKVGINLMKEPV